jgi:RimJ/RimL family protein N-acetyltransferase
MLPATLLHSEITYSRRCGSGGKFLPLQLRPNRITTAMYQQPQIAGESITIRPMRAADVDMEAEFVRRLSPQSRHYRFLGGVKELSPKELKRLCNVDGHRSMAFVATVSENGHEVEIGVSRYAPNASGDVREMAVTVADAWQNKGLGIRLTRQLIQHAREHGVRRLYSMDLADNDAMRHLAKDLGMTAMPDPDDTHQVIYSLTL